jgi:ubiquinone/menaquinone biosynthesis C-methylase UbiE
MNDEKRWNRFWKYGNVGVTPTRRNIFKEFKKIYLPIDAKILDVGCGSGTLASFWKNQGYSVAGVDISDKVLKITGTKDVYRIKADVTRGLPFKDGTFDLVYSDGLLEHFVNPKPILQEIFRVSKTYVLTLVPRSTLYNVIHNIVLRPPNEYKRKDLNWIGLHKEFNPSFSRFKKIKYGVLMILCKKG